LGRAFLFPECVFKKNFKPVLTDDICRDMIVSSDDIASCDITNNDIIGGQSIMRMNKTVRWLAFAALIVSLLSLSMGSDAMLAAAASAMGACVVLAYSHKKSGSEENER